MRLDGIRTHRKAITKTNVYRAARTTLALFLLEVGKRLRFEALLEKHHQVDTAGSPDDITRGPLETVAQLALTIR